MKTPTPIILVPLLVLLSIWAVSGAAGVRCHPRDKQVLLKINKALGNPFRSWNHKILEDCCDWSGPECDPKSNRVITLTIFQSNLSGHIPGAIGDLTYLKYLLLYQLPNLVGPIPNTIIKLTHLRVFFISKTNISGPIPDFLGQIKTLIYLDLSCNNLTGSIPPGLSELPNLGDLHLERNKLTGSIPDSFGRFRGKVPPSLYLSLNRLTGTVPRSLGDLKFRRLDFSSNKLRGDISFLFGPDKELRAVNFSRNMFEFDLSKVVFPRSLTVLGIDHNKLYGSLPQGLTLLNRLGFLNVSYNRLYGQIPVGGHLQRFQRSVYFHNRCLCGAPLSPCK